jgi:hypothetical protein
MKRVLVSILLACSSMVSAQTINPTTGQVQTTPNIIDSNSWENVIRMNGGQLSQVEGAGGGPVPAFNTDTNTIRFSYMPYTVSQIRAINSVLSEQGIKISGFNYSWQIYNDLNNTGGTRGSLNGQVLLGDSKGGILESYMYDYSNTNTGANFQLFQGTENFSKQYGLNEAAYLGVAFTGTDSNFWSGYYGPRVRDVRLGLNYSVTPPPPPPVVPTTTTPETTIVAVEPVVETVATVPTTTTSAQPVTEVASTTTPTQTNTNSSNTSTSTSTTSTSTTASVPTVQPVVQVAQSASTPTTQQSATQQTQSSASASTTNNLATALNLIKNNEKREQAIVATAVANANEVAQNAVQAAEQTATSVAASSSASSMTSTTQVTQQTTAVTQNASSSSAQSISVVANSATTSAGPQVTQNTMQNNQTPVANMSTASSATSNTNQNAQIINPVLQLAPRATTVQNNSTQVATITSSTPKLESSLPVQSVLQPLVVESVVTIQQGPVTVETPKSVMYSLATEVKSNQDTDLTIFTNNFLTNRANPMTEIVENNTRPTNNTVEQKDTVVNKNAVNNELAGGIDLERMALQPVGYNSYLQLAMRDVAFYAPKEIYRNQRVIDNQRAVRLLNFASELKHQEMVNQQYGEK